MSNDIELNTTFTDLESEFAQVEENGRQTHEDAVASFKAQWIEETLAKQAEWEAKDTGADKFFGQIVQLTNEDTPLSGRIVAVARLNHGVRLDPFTLVGFVRRLMSRLTTTAYWNYRKGFNAQYRAVAGKGVNGANFRLAEVMSMDYDGLPFHMDASDYTQALDEIYIDLMQVFVPAHKRLQKKSPDWAGPELGLFQQRDPDTGWQVATSLEQASVMIERNMAVRKEEEAADFLADLNKLVGDDVLVDNNA